MGKLRSRVMCVLALSCAPAGAQPLAIVHQPVACAVADRFPRLEARLSPAERVATARIVFQGQTADWYSVAMKPDGAIFTGVLPRPRNDLKSFRYYIETVDQALATNRTPEYTTSVVDGSGGCRGGVMAAALSSASVLVQGPAGVAALPAGFASAGVVAGSAAGAAGTAGAGSGAAGTAVAGASGVGAGGLSTGAIIGIAAGVGGAAVAGLAVAGGSDATSSGNGSVGGQWAGTWRDNDPTPNCGTLAFSTTLNLAQSGASLSGSMTNLITTVPPASSTGCATPGTSFSGPVTSGSVSGTSVQFVATLTSVSPTRIFTFTGSVSGSSLTGTYVTTIAEFPQFASRGTLSATKQ